MPKNHREPTQEELDEKINEAAEITEEELAQASIKDDESDDSKAEDVKEEDGSVVPTNDSKDEEEVETPPEETEEEKPPEEDYKKKFSESSREAQKLQAKNRVITKALIDADDVPDPTEEELSTEYGDDWEVMSDTEKRFAKEAVISKKFRERISEAKQQAAKIEKWNESVDEFVDNPKTLVDNPDLEGRTEEFKEFATKEENNSVPFKVLVGAFLHESTKGRVPNKGKMFENGSGGPNTKPQPVSDKLTLEQSRALRETNYEKYKEYLMAGKIEEDL